MPNLNDALGIHAQAVMLRARRAEVLAVNLANSDTPNYQARDIDFRSVLSQHGGDLEISQTNPLHLHSGAERYAGAELKYRTPSQPSLDQNTVDVAVERSQFIDNAIRYQASLRFLDDRLSRLAAAFRGE
jgi:flagellar basal-body rod protein FlgB